MSFLLVPFFISVFRYIPIFCLDSLLLLSACARWLFVYDFLVFVACLQLLSCFKKLFWIAFLSRISFGKDVGEFLFAGRVNHKFSFLFFVFLFGSLFLIFLFFFILDDIFLVFHPKIVKILHFLLVSFFTYPIKLFSVIPFVLLTNTKSHT